MADLASDKIAAKLPPKKERKPVSRRKPGLLHGPVATEVEAVTLRMRLTCACCANVPMVRRLLVKTGSGRHGKQTVYCIKCGVEFLQRRQTEYGRAVEYLRLGELPDGGGVRL